jgi:hypothetical protein
MCSIHLSYVGYICQTSPRLHNLCSSLAFVYLISFIITSWSFCSFLGSLFFIVNKKNGVDIWEDPILPKKVS